MCGWAIGFGGFLKSISHVLVLGPCKEALYMRRLSYFWGSGEIMYACDLKGGIFILARQNLCFYTVIELADFC